MNLSKKFGSAKEATAVQHTHVHVVSYVIYLQMNNKETEGPDNLSVNAHS